MTVVNAEAGDAAAIAEIYNYYVVRTAATFELEAVSDLEMGRRMMECHEMGLRFLVAREDNGDVVGFCRTHRWNFREAYNPTQEVSVYVAPERRGMGVGSALLERLIAERDVRATHCLVACITIPNVESVGLHEKFGFRQVSHFREVGRKLDRWHDVGHWQRLF